MSSPLSPQQRQHRRIAWLTEASAWALLLTVVAPLLIGVLVFIVVVVALT